MDDETARVFGELREVAASLGYRYHITLSAPDCPPASGWSVDEDVALARFVALVDEHSGSPGTTITLVDELERRTLAAWPGGLS